MPKQQGDVGPGDTDKGFPRDKIYLCCDARHSNFKNSYFLYSIKASGRFDSLYTHILWTEGVQGFPMLSWWMSAPEDVNVELKIPDEFRLWRWCRHPAVASQCRSCQTRSTLFGNPWCHRKLKRRINFKYKFWPFKRYQMHWWQLTLAFRTDIFQSTLDPVDPINIHVLQNVPAICCKI